MQNMRQSPVLKLDGEYLQSSNAGAPPPCWKS
jgi:hypothetical protein